MRVHAGLAGALAALALAIGAGTCGAQQPMPPDPLGGASQGFPGSPSAGPPVPRGRKTQIPNAPDTVPVPSVNTAQMAQRQNEEQRKQLAADTEKLLVLAQQLKADVDKTTKDTLSLDVVRKAEEIEKLARSVKEKMRN